MLVLYCFSYVCHCIPYVELSLNFVCSCQHILALTIGAHLDLGLLKVGKHRHFDLEVTQIAVSPTNWGWEVFPFQLLLFVCSLCLIESVKLLFVFWLFLCLRIEWADVDHYLGYLLACETGLGLADDKLHSLHPWGVFFHVDFWQAVNG